MKGLLTSLLIFSLLLARIDRITFKGSGSFCPKYTIPKWSKCPTFETEVPREVHTILNQPFTYLAKGEQSFAFVSRDGQWVLKCLRLPQYARRHQLKRKKNLQHPLNKTVASWEYAFKELKKETAVLYAHMARTNVFKKQITLVDRFGREHPLELDDLPFLLQKRGTPFFEALKKDPHILMAKAVEIYKKLYSKGFIDRDPIMDKNFAVSADTPFILDVGQLEKLDQCSSESHYLQEMTHSLAEHLEKNAPRLLDEYKSLLH